MTPLILVCMALVFLSFAALLTAAESAFSFLPRHDAEDAILKSRGGALKRIMDQPVSHMRSLRFWRIWFEMASAVAVAVLLHSVLGNVWLAGLAATGSWRWLVLSSWASRRASSAGSTRRPWSGSPLRS
ncbi:cobalt ion transmembrane transporter protein, partial [Arthrobacter sp. Hiyo6]